MKADRKRLKGEKTDLVNQMQQLYATLESREEQLRDFIRNYEQHRKVGTPTQPRSTRRWTLAPHPAQGPTSHLRTQEDCSCPLHSLGEIPDVSGPDLGPEMNTQPLIIALCLLGKPAWTGSPVSDV